MLSFLLSYILNLIREEYFIEDIMSNENNGNNVNAVAIKLPNFWTRMPAAWFVQAESQFATRNINTEMTKYHYVVQALPEDVVFTVQDILGTDLETPYTSLRKVLIERYSISESKKLEQLLSGEELGDRKPSEFFRRLKTLAGNSDLVPTKLILELWLRRLPPVVEVAVKSSNKTVTDDLLQVADSVFEVHQRQQGSVYAISSHSTSDQAITELTLQNQQLRSEMSEIRKLLSNLSVGNSSQRARSNSRRRGFSRSRSNTRSNDQDICWFHRKFGNKAQKCTSPCNFKNDPK